MRIVKKGRLVVILFILFFSMIFTLEFANAWNYQQPLENFDINTTTGMVRYRPLNQTWLYFGASSGINFTGGSLYDFDNYNDKFTLSFFGVLNSSNYIIDFADFNAGQGLVAYLNGTVSTTNKLILRVGYSFGIYPNCFISYIGDFRGWHHYVFTTNGTYLRIYMDGSLVSTNETIFNSGSGCALTWGSSNYNNCVFSWSRPSSCTTQTFRANYDELRIYNNSLDETNIIEINNSGRSPNSSLVSDNLLAWFSFNENKGLIAFDKSNYKNNASITGATWQSDNINVTTLGYEVNVSIINMSSSFVYWINNSVFLSSYTGDKVFSFLNNDTLFIFDNYLNLTIIDPKPQSYPTNSSLLLNFTFLNASINDTCIYSIKNSTGGFEKTNTTISGCSSTTFNVSKDGVYTLNLWLNNSNGNSGNSSVTFGVVTTAPAVVLNYPTPDLWFSYKTNVPFNFTATYNTGLDTCELWGNWSGTWSKNYTWIKPTNATMNFTYLNISDTRSIWNVKCNQSLGNSAWALNNFTFGIDTTYPLININDISTTPGSQTITFYPNITDINTITCKYSVYNLTGGIDGLNQNITFLCSDNTSLTVSSYSTYTLRIYSKDVANNENFTDKNFTTSSSGPSVSGGSGGSQEIEKIPVIGLLDINKTKYYSNLDREIIYAQINSFCSNKITKQPLAIQDFSGECSLTIVDIERVRSNLSVLEVEISSQDLLLFYKNYNVKSFFQGYEDSQTVEKYGLFTSILGIPNPMFINPPSLRSLVMIFQGSGNKTIEKVFYVNKNIRECSVLSGYPKLSCKVLTNTTFKISYYIDDLDFFSKIFQGSVSITSDAKPENLEVKSVPIVLTVYNFAGSLFGTPAWILLISLILIVPLTFMSGLFFIKHKQFKRFLKRR